MVSSVRFSSSTLSGGSVVLIGPGICVGVVALSGRKIVLNPCPVNVPVKADSGPSVGGRVTGTAAACAAALNTLSTWWMEKFAVLLKALVSGLGSSMGGPFDGCRRNCRCRRSPGPAFRADCLVLVRPCRARERTHEAAVASPGSARRSNFSKPIAISSGAFLARRE